MKSVANRKVGLCSLVFCLLPLSMRAAETAQPPKESGAVVQPLGKGLSPVQLDVLKALEGVDQEFKDFLALEAALQSANFLQFKDLLDAFKKKYALSAYQSFLPLFEAYYLYKAEAEEEGKDELKDLSTSLINPSEVGAYQEYLRLLKATEATQSSEAQTIARLPIYEVLVKPSESTLAGLRNYLKLYSDTDYAGDVERRIWAFYHRMANYSLLEAMVLYRDRAYVGAVSASLNTIKGFPRSKAAVQALLVLHESYQALHFPELAEQIWPLYTRNRRALLSLRPQDSVRQWFKLAESVGGLALPTPTDALVQRVEEAQSGLEEQLSKYRRPGKKRAEFGVDLDFLNLRKESGRKPRKLSKVEEEAAKRLSLLADNWAELGFDLERVTQGPDLEPACADELRIRWMFDLAPRVVQLLSEASSALGREGGNLKDEAILASLTGLEEQLEVLTERFKSELEEDIPLKAESLEEAGTADCAPTAPGE